MSFNKNINELKIGIAISTYSTKKTEQKRFDIIRKSLRSLEQNLKFILLLSLMVMFPKNIKNY